MNVAELIAIARQTPLTKAAVKELAKKTTPDVALEAATLALDSAGANAAMVLAFTTIAAGGKLTSALTRSLLPEVSTLDHVGALVFATEGPAIDVLVEFLADKRGDLELDCLILLLAAEELRRGSEVVEIPKTMLTRGRWLSRHKLSPEGAVFLGGAAIRIGDRDFNSLANPHIAKAKRAKRVIDEQLEVARMKPLDVLSDVDGTRVSTGFTVKHETPSVGRNDPCPCGSGKKYKKCHGANESAAPVSVEPPKLDAAMLGPDQTALLRPSEIAALETARLNPKAFIEAYRRVVDFRQWDLALRMIEEARAKKDLGFPIEDLVLDALHAAYDANERAPAEKLFELLGEKQREREAFTMEFLRSPPDLLARIEAEAETALRADADGARAMILGSSLLRWYPAIGVYFSRGALHESRRRDSRALLEAMEDARDRLLLSPFEAWWDVYERAFEPDEDAKTARKEDAKREKLKADLKNARAASRKLALEMEKLQKRVSELDELAPSHPSPSKKTVEALLPVAPDLVEEKKRLKSKIEELQRIIGDGQEERRELRRQIEERAEDEEPAMSAPEIEEEEDEEDDGDEAEMPRGILIPRYAERAAKNVSDLATDAADGVLTLVAALAAGKPNAWSYVKNLTKARGILSARAGIHHRVLFTVKEKTLEVLEVLHRKDLEQAVTRLAKATTSAR
jgi:hypothetical protein